MSIPSRSPIRMAGAIVHSGEVNTGEVKWTRGGTLKFTAFSGGLLPLGSGSSPPVAQTADHAILWSGEGRLNSAFPHQAISGVSIVFYDSAVVARSGPTTSQESGRATLGVLPPNTWHPGGGTLLGIQPPIAFDVPFHSGLAVQGTSGIPGFTVTFTPGRNANQTDA